MPTDDKVSIITPAYNSAEFLETCYRSISGQSWENWEWVIQDDGSQDRTGELLARLARSDPRIRPGSFTSNQGAAAARNACIDRSDGTFCAFLDVDDSWHTSKLSVFLKRMQEDDLDISFGPFVISDTEGKDGGRIFDATAPAEIGYDDLLRKRAVFGCSTVVVRRSIIGQTRMPPLRSGQDYAFWLSLLKKGYRARKIDEPLTYYRLTPNSLSRNKARAIARQWHIYRRVEAIDWPRSVGFMMSYAYRSLKARVH